VNELPRRPIEPLPPPPGQFDAVLARTRYRRHRKVTTVLTVSTVFMAGIAGGISLSGDITQVRARIAQAAADVGIAPPAETSSSPPASRTPKTKNSKRPRVLTRTATVEVPPPVVAQPKPRGMLAVRGRAVDVAGAPVAGLFVYPGRQGVDGFVPTSNPAGRTAKDGTFSLPCHRTPVLLSPWPVNAPATDLAASAIWTATFVGGATDAASAPSATCSRGRVVETIVQGGSAVEGAVTMPADCADSTHPLWLWLHNDRDLTVRIPDLVDGASFRIAGLPPGQHTLGANGSRTKVTVGGGETQTLSVPFACEPGTPLPSPEPTASTTPSGLPTPSETATPEPSSSGSSEPVTTERPSPASSPTNSTAALRG
jgi:hypothetical protein